MDEKIRNKCTIDWIANRLSVQELLFDDVRKNSEGIDHHITVTEYITVTEL